MKLKVLKKILFAFLIIITVIFAYLNRDLIKTIVITSNSGKSSESLLEENANNYTLVESKDGYKVPVPTGYTASSVESEMYVNGVDEVHTGTKTELEFTSSGEYPWTQNEDDGVWVSGNKGIVSTTSTLTSNEFTVGEQGGRLTVNWSVSCDMSSQYLYAEIENVETGEVIRTSNISGTVYGTVYSRLIYTTLDKDLEAGTYTVLIKYYKSSGTSAPGLDSGYVKSASVISYDEVGEDTVTVHKYGGFVIYEGTEEVSEANLDTAKRTRNQWVWVPVDSDRVDRIYTESDTGVKTGKAYSYSVSGRTLSSSLSHEPELLPNYDNEYYFIENGFSGMTRESFYQELQLEFENTIESIKKYGGFYIGRYETGNITSDVPVVQKMNISLGNATWYSMYSKMSYLGANSYVKTNMIWGCLWDETLQWLVDSGSLKQDELIVSMSWGNYTNSSITYTTTSETMETTSIGSRTLIPAGSSEDTKVNNIYDMAGNIHEWTLDVYQDGRSIRGGFCGSTGINLSASSGLANVNPSSSDSNRGSRSYLYIQ